jgi:hypothetical protein
MQMQSLNLLRTAFQVNAMLHMHVANAVPEAASAADTVGGAAAAQSSRSHAHSCLLQVAMHRAKKGTLHGPGAYVCDGVETTHVHHVVLC